ncbi:MAG: hypothetical protein M3R02_14520 [Chloroflexota bacterium]|nr:hypothetical protein [Chloroflexota bacterium]
MTSHQPSTVQIAREDRVFGSKLTAEEREWQITKLLPAILDALEDAADAVNADAGKDAAGQSTE